MCLCIVVLRSEHSMEFIKMSKEMMRNKMVWVLVLLSAAALFYLSQYSLVLKDTVMIDEAGKEAPMVLPFTKAMPDGSEYVIRGKMDYHRYISPDLIHILPDDQVLAIRVNQQNVPLDDVDPVALGDYQKGFHYPISRYLRDGGNEVEFRIKNGFGASGLVLKHSIFDIKNIIVCGILLVLALTIGYYFLASMISNKVFIFIILGGFVIRVAYFLVTPYYVRDHDLDGHIEYIQYVLQHWTRPPENFGWEGRQPPVYYFLAAIVYKVSNLLGISHIYYLLRIQQALSLLLSVAFLIAALFILKHIMTHLPCFKQQNHETSKTGFFFKTLGLTTTKDRLIAFMLCMITFWPSNIMHSVRVGNDSLFYFLYAMSLLYLVKWYFDNRDESLYIGAIFTAFCMITKASGLILYGITGIVVLWKIIRERAFKKNLVRIGVLFIFFIAVMMIIFGNTIELKLKGSSEHFMVGDANILHGQYVGNNLINYVWFDVPVFISITYADPWADTGGRQYFWNYLLKTALVGEFGGFDSTLQRILIISMSVMLLFMIILVVAGLITILIKEFNEHIILFSNFVLLLISAIMIRVSLPASCINDFRYILPILIPFSFFYGYTIHTWRQKAVAVTGYVLAFLFMAASGVFILSLLF